MIIQMFKRRIVSETLELQIVQWMIMVCVVLIPGYGFCKMAPLELTPTQWLLGFAIIIALVLQCMILTALIELRIDLKRKAA
jgi:hypothetical protein